MHRADRPRRAESRLPSEPTERPSGARRRIASDNDEESTAQFIERIRLELVQQLHRPQEFESIARRRPAVV
ncbi:unnamed protein product [Heligmosomoides polygyrus]|uniref:GntR family transcriptional regulator n=1 Tax=Heligmosomoides polygyrus TaxID=6339 RepID=A0A183FFD6_HELPZ|nr:unnamed protein product [Heligmosomoides polygyrus]